MAVSPRPRRSFRTAHTRPGRVAVLTEDELCQERVRRRLEELKARQLDPWDEFVDWLISGEDDEEERRR